MHTNRCKKVDEFDTPTPCPHVAPLTKRQLPGSRCVSPFSDRQPLLSERWMWVTVMKLFVPLTHPGRMTSANLPTGLSVGVAVVLSCHFQSSNSAGGSSRREAQKENKQTNNKKKYTLLCCLFVCLQRFHRGKCQSRQKKKKQKTKKNIAPAAWTSSRIQTSQLCYFLSSVCSRERCSWTLFWDTVTAVESHQQHLAVLPQRLVARRAKWR